MFEILQPLFDDPGFKSEVRVVEREFKAHEKIVEQGKSHPCFYLIKQGKVRVIVHGEIKANSPVRPGIADLGPNDIFGELGLFDQLPANADVVAVVDSLLVEIDLALFRTYLETHRDQAYHVLVAMLNTLIYRLRHADKTILTLYLWGLKQHDIDKYL